MKIPIEQLEIGKHTVLCFNCSNPYEIYTDLPDSYSDDEFKPGDIDKLITWLQSIRPRMYEKISVEGKSYTKEEARALIDKLQEFINA